MSLSGFYFKIFFELKEKKLYSQWVQLLFLFIRSNLCFIEQELLYCFLEN